MSKTIDLAWGNPEFLHKIWETVPMEEVLDESPGNYSNGKGLLALKVAILALHKRTHGYSPKKKVSIVIGAGATQVIQAAVYAHNKQQDQGKIRVFANTPHYSRFPILTELAGGHWTRYAPQVEIITSPNNPDGKIPQSPLTAPKQIHDYSYNWKTYTSKIQPMDKDLMIFSMAKLSGHSDMRIGWAIVKDAKTAELMEEYIEMNTSGVSKQAQQAAISVLTTITTFSDSYFNGASEKLKSRWSKIESLKLPFKVLNKQGMFLYCKGECPKNIKGINGIEFSDSTENFRLNIGCSDKVFDQFVKQYEK